MLFVTSWWKEDKEMNERQEMTEVSNNTGDLMTPGVGQRRPGPGTGFPGPS